MDEHISRQAVIDALHTKFKDGFDEDKWWNSTHVLAAIEAIPAADVIVPVRCEDCKHHSFDAGYGNYWCNLTSGARKVKRFDYCSYGEKRKE